MRLHDALDQVRLMQLQVARVEQYCCYRWATVSCTGFIALVAAGLQAMMLPQPAVNVDRFLLLWISVAAVSICIVAAEMLFRWLRSESEFERRQTVTALRQFTPSLFVGALMTLVIRIRAPEQASMLPGLWALVFSLGIFSSWKCLPTGTLAVAMYYLASGLLCLGWSQGTSALQPWTMAGTFGIGQLLTGWVLFRKEITEHGTR